MRALIAASLAALSIGGAYAADTLAPVPTVAEENPKGTLDNLAGSAIPNTDPVQYYPAGGSAYTLTKLQEGGEKPTGENVITKFTYNSETHTLTPIYYRLDLNKTEYGSGDSVKYYGWTTNENGDKTFGEVDAADAEILGRYNGTTNQLDRIDGTTGMTGSDIEGNFVNQTVEGVDERVNGGAIKNNSQLGNVTGDFVDNAITSNLATDGGALSSGTFGDIEGNFFGNSTLTTEYQPSNQTFGTHGGAIYSANTGNITGNFIGNHASTPVSYADAGAIYANKDLGDITGDFIGNYAEGAVENASGGAIVNYGSTIKSITGNFIGNYVTNINGNAYGGAINNYWRSEIGDITGDFIGNYAKTVSGEAQGGAIRMMHNGNKLNNITGDFIGNYAESDAGTAYGGAIYNNSFLEGEPSIKSITGDFIDNHVKGSSVYGGAIYNTNTIGDIDGDFYNNYALGSSTAANVSHIYASGGAVYNAYSDSALGTITGNFINNYIQIDTPVSSYAYLQGGAIYSQGTIAGLVGYFINNHIESEYNAYTNGGAIYNSGTIDNIQGGFYGNYIDTKFGNANGGAIYNYKTITNIEADFVDNRVSGESAVGGAINNNYGGTIGTLSGNFSGNSAVASQANALGGAISNYNVINTLNGDFTDNLAQSVSSAFGGAIYNSSSINEINSNFSGNIADGKNDASGGAVYNYGNLGFEMDYVKGMFANNEARSENYAAGGAVYNSNYIGTGLSNSGIDGTFTNNKAIAAEPVARPYSSGSVSGYPDYGEEELASHYAAGGAIYNAGIIKNIKGDYNNNLAQVSFADSNALAEGGAILAVTDSLATSALSDEYMQSGEINVPSTMLEGGGGAGYYDPNIFQYTVKVGDETRTVYVPTYLSESGINTIVSADLGEMTEEEWNEAMAAGTVYTSLDQLQNAYNKQIMKISANFDSNKAEAAISGDARGGAISFVETNSDFTPLPPSNGISTMGIAPGPDIDISGGNALITHTSIVVDGEVLSEFNILGTTLPEGSKIGYVNLLPQKEYIIENSTFTNNAAVANNGNAYGGAVSITSNPGQLSLYAEQEISMTEEEFISFIQGFGGTEITTKEEALAVFNAMLEEMKTAGMVSDADNVQDLILEGYETVSSSKNKFIFKNTSFVNNTAEASGDNAEAHGGAIYSQSDVTIQADNAESIISGNTTITNGTVDQEAIYMDKSEFSEEPLVLELDTINNGKILLDDKINGSEQYIVNLTGDSTGQTVFNNSVNNAHIITNDGSNTFLTKETHWDGNDLTMNGGNLSFLNNSVGVASLNNITVTKDTNFVADVDLANESMDRFTANTYGEHTGNLHVTGMNLLSDAPEDRDVTEIYFAEQGLKDNVINGVSGGTGELPDSYQTTAYTPIYRYNVAYDNRDDAGYFVFAKGDRIIQTPGGGTTGGGTTGGGITTTPSGNPSDAFNPAVLSSPVAAQAGAYAAQYAAFNYAFEHADTFMPLPSNERFALKNANRYAITGYDNMVYNTSDFPSKAMWVRPYTSFENISLKNGPDVDTITYGTLIGGNSDLKELKNGWSTIFTGYVGYNGSSQSYSGVNTYQNGGLLGATQTFYKGNFFTAVTASAGAMAGESHNMYGHENFTTLLAGVASKTGYNFEFKDGKFIIQPIWLMSYSFINTFDYTNSAGVRIDSDPLHAIQLNPSVRFIANMKNGWQPYASVGMVWNILDDTKVRANDVRLPEMSVKPFVEYGLGIQKRWNDKYTGYLQAMVRNGGRTGVALTAGFRWALGNEGKPIEKVHNPVKEKTSYLNPIQQDNKMSVSNQTGGRKILKQLTPAQRVVVGAKDKNTSLTSRTGVMK